MPYSYTTNSNLFHLVSRHLDSSCIPPELDIDFYKLLHEDLKNLTDEEIKNHFEEFGRSEGRFASPAAHRSGFVKLLPTEADVLEIGPFTKPVLTGANIKYFDVLDKSGLLARAREIGFPIQADFDIDYVSSVGDLSIVPENEFDAVFSSHCIEHQPDLVRHLVNVSRILKEGGRYFLIVPDKRYCFDHFLEASSLDNVLKAFEERRMVHTMTSVFEHHALTTHSDPIGHWSNWHDDPNASDIARRAAHAVKIFDEARGSYIDVHAWQFTPQSFRYIIDELRKRELIDLSVERVYDTVWSQYEFMAILKSS
ncbi:methyltransferase domain-containing protein [Methylobacterium sp. Leaf117]|uniref:methyltransferase domain-containing protein n=1 Tax=Methylobacterium sp. Leaf117 TaxID=1736260 RepID=UPI0009E875BA|nr:methyltransferase domain-containing protein [Methylobacterium sp. Leaf117]